MKLSSLALFLAITSSSGVSAVRKKDFPLFSGNYVQLLEDVYKGGVYDSVYIHHHKCVWSETEQGSDGYGGCNQDEGEEEENNNYDWYKGHTPCFRANAAYSLYGVKKGNQAPNNPCRPFNYINSFFTDTGVDSFARVMNMNNGNNGDEEEGGNGGVSTQCEAQWNDNGNEENGNNYDNYVSYTTGCAVDGSYVTAKYAGSHCQKQRRLSSTDSLDNFNGEVNYMECQQIYDGQGSYSMNGQEGEQQEEEDNGEERKLEDYYEGDDWNEEAEEEEEEQQENNNGELQSEGTLFNLLARSTDCSIFEYPLACPDPWGAKSIMDWNPVKAKRWKWFDLGALWTGLWAFATALFFGLCACCLGRRVAEMRSHRGGRRGYNTNSQKLQSVANDDYRTHTTNHHRYDNTTRISTNKHQTTIIDEPVVSTSTMSRITSGVPATSDRLPVNYPVNRNGVYTEDRSVAQNGIRHVKKFWNNRILGKSNHGTNYNGGGYRR